VSANNAGNFQFYKSDGPSVWTHCLGRKEIIPARDPKHPQTERVCVCACERIMYDKVEIHALMMMRMRMRMMIILPTRTLRMIMVRMMR